MGSDRRGPWSTEEIDRLDTMLAGGLDARRIAKALDRPLGNVLDRIEGKKAGDSRVVLGDSASENTRAKVDRILELHGQGALSSRIARIVGLSVERIDATIRKTGKKPNVLKSYRTGRYGVDLPLPVAQVEELPPIPVRPAPAPQPVVEPEPAPEPTPAPEPLREETVAQTPEPELEASPMPKKPETAVANANPSGRTHWSISDVDILRSYQLNGATTAEIAKILGRTTTAVKKMRAKIIRDDALLARTDPFRPSLPIADAIQPGTFKAIQLPGGDIHFLLDTQIEAAQAQIAKSKRAVELMEELRELLSRAA